jgi:DNA polymerase-1
VSEYRKAPGLSGVKLTYVDSVEEANQLISWLGERRETDFLALDTETAGLDEYSDDSCIRLVQVGDMQHGWAFRWDRWQGLFFEIMEKWDKEWVLHNAPFDIRHLERHSEWRAPWSRVGCTMVMSQVDDPLRRSHQLKQLTTSLIDKRAQAGQNMLEEEMKTNNWTWGTIPFSSLAYTSYSSLDVVLTAQLAYALETPTRYAEAYDLEMSAQRVCTQMSQAGSRVDLIYSAQKKAELEEYAEKVKEWGKKTYNTVLTSNPQLVRLFETLGGEITERTPKGAPSVNKIQLEAFMTYGSPEIKQIATLVTDLKKAVKISSTYFDNFLEQSVDGFIHPQIKTMAAKTSRMSITSPPCQTLPSNDATVRRAFLPRTDEERIVSVDYDQIESRLMAHYSGDENLIRAFEEADSTGSNFFIPFGRSVFNDPNFSKKDPRYKSLKSCWYGKCYGASPFKMSVTARVPVEEMEHISRGIDTSYPNIKKFQDSVVAIGDKREREEGRGYIVTADGRKLYSERAMSYTLFNYVLQGSAAILLKKAMVSLDNAGLGKYMLLPVHDEVLFSIPENECASAIPEITSIMSHIDGFRVPLTAGAEGPFDNWGQKHEGNESSYADIDILDFTEPSLA